MTLASGGGPEEVTWFEGEAWIAASVAVKSCGTAPVCAAGSLATGGGGGTTDSFSRECRDAHPATLMDRISKPAAMRAPKTSFETIAPLLRGRTSPLDP